MSDTSYPVFEHYGTNAERLAFTPSPAGGQPIYVWYETDNDVFYIYTTAWKGPFGSGGSGTVTNTGTLTAGKTIIGNGTVDVTVSSLTAQFVGSSSGTEAAASMSTAKMLGRTTAGSGAVEEITVGNGLTLATTTLTGTVGQMVSALTTGVATGSTQIPTDDSIPQNTEGDEYMTVTITPKSATSVLVITAAAMVACSASRTMSMALFQDTTANALAAVCNFIATANGNTQFLLQHTMTSGTTSATTFKIRIGANSTGTVTFNGNSSARLYGAINKSSIVVTEYL